MATPIIMPKFGQMTEESAIVEWLKKEGDKVAKGDILFTVETDKSVMEVESFEAGTLLKIVVPPGVSVPVQSTVGFLGKPGEADSRGMHRPAPGSQAAGGSRALSPARRRASRLPSRRTQLASTASSRSAAPITSNHSSLPPPQPAVPHQPPRARRWRAIASSTRPASRAPGPAAAWSRRT